MKLLAWDTSSKAGALVALEWNSLTSPKWEEVRLCSEWSLNVDSTHSDSLLWGIHQVLEASRWKLEEVDYFGVGIGPGSFTGLRIGLTTARTLAHTLGKPIVSISSLAALARPVALQLAPLKTPVCVISATDACKGEFFALWGNAAQVKQCVSVKEQNSDGLWKRGVEEKVLSPEALMAAIKKQLSKGKTQWTVVGEGRHRYTEAWKLLPKARHLAVEIPFLDQIQGRYVGQLAWEAIQAGLARPALEVHPRYLRASDAELKLKKGLLPPGPTRSAPNETQIKEKTKSISKGASKAY